MDSAGNIYIADSSNDRIRKVTVSSGIITTVAGTGVDGFAGDGGLATSASLSQPDGIALDAAGNLYIADDYNNRVREVTAASGLIYTIAGDGIYGYSGDGGPAIVAELDCPSGIAVQRRMQFQCRSLRAASRDDVGKHAKYSRHICSIRFIELQPKFALLARCSNCRVYQRRLPGGLDIFLTALKRTQENRRSPQ